MHLRDRIFSVLRISAVRATVRLRLRPFGRMFDVWQKERSEEGRGRGAYSLRLFGELAMMAVAVWSGFVARTGRKWTVTGPSIARPS